MWFFKKRTLREKCDKEISKIWRSVVKFQLRLLLLKQDANPANRMFLDRIDSELDLLVARIEKVHKEVWK